MTEEDDNGETTTSQIQNKDNESSSEDNDSTAAAHAAAIGHSPKPVKAAVHYPSTIPEHLVQGPLKSNPLKPRLESLPSGTDPKLQVSDPSNNGPESRLTENGNMPPSTSKDADVAKPDPKGDHDEVPKKAKLVLNPEILLNEKDEDENTALHIAIHARKLEHTRILLEAGASVRIRSDGSLPIHTAISMGSLRTHTQFSYECVVLLKEHGADLSMKDDSMQTPLFLACMFNLPQVVEFILSDEEGFATLNCRSDRAGNRPLHAASKFDTPENTSFSKRAASIATGQTELTLPPNQQQVPNKAMATDNPVVEKPAEIQRPPPVATPTTEALLTQVLLGSTGIELDAINSSGQTPLHIACMRRNWPVVRLLLQAGANASLVDKKGYTPGQLAHKRGAPIPNDLTEPLGGPPKNGIIPPPRELIVDPDGSTVVLCHELCMKHHTCSPIRRDSDEPPPENIRRLRVLVDAETGILRTGEFSNVVWVNATRRAAIADVLKVRLLFVYFESAI